MKIIYSMEEIPKNMDDRQAAEFWATHAMSEELLESVVIEEDDDLPRRKKSSVSVSIRIDADLLKRIKILALDKGKGYQSLIKEFLIERTYEEEKKSALKADFYAEAAAAKEG